MEILFEQDNEEKSVASLILDCLVKVEFYYAAFLFLLLSWQKGLNLSKFTFFKPSEPLTEEMHQFIVQLWSVVAMGTFICSHLILNLVLLFHPRTA